ncbi:hypothetical protein FRC11_006359, partial [Ceratobasidium sp. 423]
MCGEELGVCKAWLSLIESTICKPSKRVPDNQEWKTAQNMKRHVSTTVHELALNEARVRSVSTDMRPPLPPPSAPWAIIRPAYSESHPSSSSRILSAPHADSDTDTGSGSGSDCEILLSPHARARKRTKGLPGEQNAHTLSAADDIYLEQDPNLNASAAQTEDIDSILASILNETPVWEPGPDDIVPSVPPVNSSTRPWPDNIDMSNPEVRAMMEFHPTDGEGEISEIWDGEKLANGLSPEQLTPMVAVGKSHYFVNEFCELDDGVFFIPEMFVRRQGANWARGYDVECRQV